MAHRRSSRDNLRGPPGPPPKIPLPPLPLIPNVSRHLPPLPDLASIGSFSSMALPPFSPNMPPLDLSQIRRSQGTSGSSRPTRSSRDPLQASSQSNLRRSSSQRLRRTSFHTPEEPNVLSAPADVDEFRAPRPPTLSPATPLSLRPSSSFLGDPLPSSSRQEGRSGSTPRRTIRAMDNFELPTPPNTDTDYPSAPSASPRFHSADITASMDLPDLGLPPPEFFGISAASVGMPEGLPWLPEPLFAEERTAVRSQGAPPPGHARCAGCKDLHRIEDLRSLLSMGPIYCNRCYSKLARERSSSSDLRGLGSSSGRTRRSSISSSALPTLPDPSLPDLSNWASTPQMGSSSSGFFGSIPSAGSVSFSDPFDMPMTPQRRSGTPTIGFGNEYRGGLSNISPISTSTISGMPPLSYSSGSGGGSTSRRRTGASTSHSTNTISFPTFDFDPNWAGGLSSNLGTPSHTMPMSPSSPSYGGIGSTEGGGVQGHRPLRRDSRRISRTSSGELRITDWLNAQQPFQGGGGGSSSSWS